jgi:tRNA(Ile)-lysidine synthase
MSGSQEFLTPTEAVRAVAAVPSGAWAVGVSGGADSVALFHLLCDLSAERGDLRLEIVHLNHQTRGAESDDDECFVRGLVGSGCPPIVSAKRDGVERDLVTGELPANPSARFRALRHALFSHVVKMDHLQGVLLAHHADDQAETVMQRLLRGSGWTGLCGMSGRTVVRGGLTIVRPLLRVRRAALREYLTSRGLTWREDASNRSPKYQRNVVRAALAGRDDLTAALLALASQCAALREWVREHAPTLGDSFSTGELADLPKILARRAAAKWLTRHGVPPDELDPATVDRLLLMCDDAASSAKVTFPGNLVVRRRGGRVFTDSSRAG